MHTQQEQYRMQNAHTRTKRIAFVFILINFDTFFSSSHLLSMPSWQMYAEWRLNVVGNWLRVCCIQPIEWNGCETHTLSVITIESLECYWVWLYISQSFCSNCRIMMCVVRCACTNDNVSWQKKNKSYLALARQLCSKCTCICATCYGCVASDASCTVHNQLWLRINFFCNHWAEMKADYNTITHHKYEFIIAYLPHFYIKAKIYHSYWSGQ